MSLCDQQNIMEMLSQIDRIFLAGGSIPEQNRQLYSVFLVLEKFAKRENSAYKKSSEAVKQQP
jgi:hypothetical protein